MSKKVKVGDYVHCVLDEEDSYAHRFNEYKGLVSDISSFRYIHVDSKYFFQGNLSNFKYRIKRTKRFGPWIYSKSK